MASRGTAMSRLRGFFAIMLCFMSLNLCTARIHNLTLTKDKRASFAISSFGLLKEGSLEFLIHNLSLHSGNARNPLVGFSIDLETSASSSVSNYQEKTADVCKGFNGHPLGRDKTKKLLLFFTVNKRKVFVNVTRYGLDGVALVGAPSQSQLEIAMESNETDLYREGKIGTIDLPDGKDFKFSYFFVLTVTDPKGEGLFSTYFHNCDLSSMVNTFKMDLIEHNPDSYLAAGEIPLPTVYFCLSVVFFVTAWVWFYVLRNATENVYKMHYLMFLAMLCKSLSFLFHGVNYYTIGINGTRETAWAVMYYITYLLKTTMLFLTIILVGMGWTFLKHVFSPREKKLFLVVIPLQLLAYVATVILEESEEGDKDYTTWTQILFIVDLICCGAIIFPVIWSIRHLQEASQTNGKAAINLRKLKLFRQFYVLVVAYIYATRVIATIFEMIEPFTFVWVGILFKEVVTYLFMVFTGYKFRPTPSNPYFTVPTEDDDEDPELAEVVTVRPHTEGLKRIVRDPDNSGGGEGTNTMKHRESSHDYD